MHIALRYAQWTKQRRGREEMNGMMVFYNSMGHMPQTMMSKPIMGHVFAAIQFLVGDLAADTTPSAKLAVSKQETR